jgi:hypothetical protein
MARSIQSPGVQISEQDFSLRAAANDITNVLVAGFAQQGPTYEPIVISSLVEFEQVFGTPSNAAERYFYHTARAVFQSPATMYAARLGYGNGLGEGFGSKYTALVYPVRGKVTQNDDVQTNLQIISGAGDMYLLGKPNLVELTDTDYNNIKNGSAYTWKANVADVNGVITSLTDFGNAGVIVLNKQKYTTNSIFEGYYLGLIDNTTVNPSVDYRGINYAYTVSLTGTRTGGTNIANSYTQLLDSRLNFPLSATFAAAGSNTSVSEDMEFTTFNIGTTAYRDCLNVGLFKLFQSTFSPSVYSLGKSLVENYTGSINYYRQQYPDNGGIPTSFFLSNVEDTSPSIEILVNPWISKRDSSDNNVTIAGDPRVSIRVLGQGLRYAASIDSTFTGITPSVIDTFIAQIGQADALFPLGSYTLDNPYTKVIGNVPGKVDKLLQKLENFDVYPLTLTVEGGLGTIYASSSANNGIFDDTKYNPAYDNLSSSTGITGDALVLRNAWASVFETFRVFAENVRKDHLFIADPLIPIFIQGTDVKTISRADKNFTSNIYWPLRNVFDPINTSYACTYANVAKVNDPTLNRPVWVPFSGFAASLMAKTDLNYQPWFAPAGFKRGTVGGAVDLALYPKQKQRDQLYKIGTNPVAFFPAEGFVVYGQKTLQKQPSAFDRINVRRLFINLETLVRNTVKSFIFEPNTLFTRTQVINTISPFFENAKNTQGVYDYLIVCDEKNNTPAVIDDNTLVVDVYIKPTRTAEYILVNFYATRTNQDFNEIVS